MGTFFQKAADYTKDAISAGKYLLQGLAVTFDHMRRRPITVQYPYEKLIPSERYRAVSYTHLTLPTIYSV